MDYIPCYIIAFTGRKGVGKTTAAKYLQDNYEFKIYSFANPLKELCKRLGVTKEGEILNKDLKHLNISQLVGYCMQVIQGYEPNYPIDPVKIHILAATLNTYYNCDSIERRKELARKILQFVGTDIFRSWDPNYWVSKLIKQIYNDIAKGNVKRIAIDDMRFKNEYQALVDFPLEIIRDDTVYVVNKTFVGIFSKKVSNEDNHISETEVDKLMPYMDFKIENNFDDKFFDDINKIALSLNLAR